MKTKIAVLTLLTLSVIATVLFKQQRATSLQEPPKAQVSPLEDSLSKLSSEELKKDIEFLASDDLEGRMSGKRGNDLAADFLKKELEASGLPTEFDDFQIRRMNLGPKNEIGEDKTRNLYSWIEGDDLRDEVVVLGAHFDHIGYGPRYSRSKSQAIHNGADDNASGTAAVLEIAKAMAGLKPRRTILFQFYSAEEMGLLGSRHYCDNPTFPRQSPNISKHVAMVNMDMIGHLRPDAHQVSMLDSSLDIAEIVKSLDEKYSFAAAVTGRGAGGSDHASFYNKRIPVAFIHTGVHKYYHTPEDDVGTINMGGVLQVSRYGLELVWRLANEERPEFNKASFKEMPYDHDHGQIEF